MAFALPRILSGLGEIAAGYDSLVCDVWGVLHDGRRIHAPAAEALIHFRENFGPVVLLSNAPRLAREVQAQLDGLGVPRAAYDGIVTSGEAARADLARRAKNASRPLALLHVGPERDRLVHEGLSVRLVAAPEAEIVLCTGLYDDETETLDTYKGMLADFRTRNLTLLCANPDIVVQRGNKLVFCAGAIARAYEAIGGRAVYFGKPHPPVYETVSSFLRERGGTRPLAIGDGLGTDIRGANAAGLDALFIADGIHGEEIGPGGDAESVARLLARERVTCIAAMVALAW